MENFFHPFVLLQGYFIVIDKDVVCYCPDFPVHDGYSAIFFF